MRVLILVFEIFRLVSFSMECSCMAPLTHVVMVMSRLVFHPLFHMVSILILHFLVPNLLSLVKCSMILNPHVLLDSGVYSRICSLLLQLLNAIGFHP